MTHWIAVRLQSGDTPLTGLSPTVTVFDLANDSKVINAAVMTEVGEGYYKYDATSALSEDGNYVGHIDAGTDNISIRYLELDFSTMGISENQTDLNGIKAKTDNLKDVWNDISQDEANAACDAALTDYDPPTKAELDVTESNIRGADNDTLKDISDQVDSINAELVSGSGSISWTYTLTETSTGDPISDAKVWVTTDKAGDNVIAGGRTDQYGKITFQLDAGTVYVWRLKYGYSFDNPDTEVVSA